MTRLYRDGKRFYFRGVNAGKTLDRLLYRLVRLADFFHVLGELRVAESRFKNVVLTTYHDESVAAINGKFDAFVGESVSVRAALHEIRQAIRYRLKPSHGHPRNANALKSLLTDFLRANSACSEALSDLRDRAEVSVRR